MLPKIIWKIETAIFDYFFGIFKISTFLSGIEKSNFPAWLQFLTEFVTNVHFTWLNFLFYLIFTQSNWKEECELKADHT